MTNHLENLKKLTRVVADTGEISLIGKYKPEDATTNPSLILKAARQEQYREVVEKAIRETLKEKLPHVKMLDRLIVKLFVSFGREILKHVKHRVSTEVDPQLSFDTKASISKAKEFIKEYESLNIPRERILIKLASTWEGIRAGEELEKEGIHCNMTLMFGLSQAITAAEANVTLISPFVGRIFDWHKAKDPEKYTGLNYKASEDPGVLSVTNIYNYYKKFGYTTEIMGASFRNTDQLRALAGCDLLTIAPNLLEELEHTTGHVEQMLDAKNSQNMNIVKRHIDENTFRWDLNEDAMATEKLSEGIRAFHKDTSALKSFLLEGFSYSFEKKRIAL